MRRAALALALLIGMLPLCAGAETIPVTAVRFSDPVYAVDGEVVHDLTGLTLQIAGGSAADGSLGMLFLDLFALDENLGSAVLQFEDGALAAYLGGMTKAYGMPADEAGLPRANLLEDLEEWAFLDHALALFEDFMMNGADVGYYRSIEVPMHDGVEEMEYISIGGDATEFCYDLAELAEEDAILGAYLSELEAGMSLSDVLRGGGFRATLEVGLGSSDDYMDNLIDYRLGIEMDGEETAISGRVIVEDNGNGNMRFSLHNAEVCEDYTETTRLSWYIRGAVWAIEGAILTDGEDEEYDSLYEFAADYSQASRMPYARINLTIADVYAGMTLDAGVSANYLTGETHVELNHSDGTTDTELTLSYKPDKAPAEGARSSGALALSVDRGDSVERLTLGVSVIEATVDAEAFRIDPAVVVDLTDMTEGEASAALAELERIMREMTVAIEETVPGFAGIAEMF